MSASGMDQKFAARYWNTPKVTPHTSAAGQISRRPRLPSTMNASASGTKTDSTGVCRPTIAPRSSTGSPVTVASVVTGTASAPNATGAVFATSATRRRLERAEAERDQHDGADRHRRAETGQRLHERAEAERDDDGLHALVVADRREGAAQDVEVAGLDGEVVDPDRVDDDPHDREEAEGGAEQAAVERVADRHRIHDDGDEDRDDQSRRPRRATRASARCRAGRTGR